MLQSSLHCVTLREPDLGHIGDRGGSRGRVQGVRTPPTRWPAIDSSSTKASDRSRRSCLWLICMWWQGRALNSVVLLIFVLFFSSDCFWNCLFLSTKKCKINNQINICVGLPLTWVFWSLRYDNVMTWQAPSWSPASVQYTHHFPRWLVGEGQEGFLPGNVTVTSKASNLSLRRLALCDVAAIVSRQSISSASLRRARLLNLRYAALRYNSG